MRKPRPFESRHVSADIWEDPPVYEKPGAFVVVGEMMDANANECERLAAWLLKAAEWIREQEKRGAK